MRLLRELAREEMDIRMSVLPFVQAENDCKEVFIKSKQAENEAELMKAIPDWEAGANVYKTTTMAPMRVFGLHK